MKELSISGYARAWIVDEATSTMDLAREALPTLGSSYGVVCARKQSAGRGRQGRSWSSSEGALMATFLLPMAKGGVALGGYSLVVGVGIQRALKALGVPLALKWPNDLVVVREGALCKVGGILVEVQEVGNARSLLVGVGINLVAAPSEVVGATSAADVGGVALTLEDALLAVATTLRENNELFASQGFSAFRSAWESSSCFEAGRTVLRLDVGGGEVVGRFAGIDDSGALCVTTDEGVRTIYSAHVLEVRLR